MELDDAQVKREEYVREKAAVVIERISRGMRSRRAYALILRTIRGPGRG